uniref:(northern house mosquito) hypothetical protein n=1 Tax=Culex pipiens TaxID=7175 RepID=A0A8D8JS74_CULPI
MGLSGFDWGSCCCCCCWSNCSCSWRNFFIPLAVSTLPLPLSSTMPNRVNSFNFWGEILITRWFFLPGFTEEVVAGWDVMRAPLEVANSGLPPEVPGSACFLPELFFCDDADAAASPFLCPTSVVTFCTTTGEEATGRGFVAG